MSVAGASPPKHYHLRDLATWRELLARAWQGTHRHRSIGLAAEVAFFALFSFPPMLLSAFAAVGFVGGALGPDVTSDVRAEVLQGATRFLTQLTIEKVVAPTFDALTASGRVDLLSIGLVVALWSASQAADALLSALHIAYDIDHRIAMWRRRGRALAYTVVGVLLAGVLLPVLVVGPQFGYELARRVGQESTFALVWSIAYWPVVVGGIVLVLTGTYHFAMPWRTPFFRDLPGAVFALLFFLSGSWALRVYGAWVLESSPVYGAIAAPMALLLWLYFVALSILLGAEINAAIESMWPTVERREKRRVLREAVLELEARGEDVAALAPGHHPRDLEDTAPVPQKTDPRVDGPRTS
jgi:membrane protein